MNGEENWGRARHSPTPDEDGTENIAVQAIREAHDPILALLAKLDAAMARGGGVQIDGRMIRVRAVADGIYRIERP